MSLGNRATLGVIAFALAVGTAAAGADVVAVVSSKSSVTALSRNQVVDIFLGKTSRYPDGEQAVPIDQVEGAAARDEFYATFTGKSAAQIKAHWSKIIFTGRGQPPRELPNSIEVKKVVVQDPKAIGYIERSFVDDKVRVLLSR
jgi:ABC-type phosphate transport system substrate-binding protein